MEALKLVALCLYLSVVANIGWYSLILIAGEVLFLGALYVLVKLQYRTHSKGAIM